MVVAVLLDGVSPNTKNIEDVKKRHKSICDGVHLCVFDLVQLCTNLFQSAFVCVCVCVCVYVCVRTGAHVSVCVYVHAAYGNVCKVCLFSLILYKNEHTLCYKNKETLNT